MVRTLPRALVAVVLLVSLAALGSCGFRPLYGARAGGAATHQALAAINIPPARNRLNQMVRDQLLDIMTPRGRPRNALYRLDFTVDQEKSAAAIEQDESVERYNLVLTAPFRLVATADNRILMSATARSVTAFNVVLSDYATLVAEQDAASRAAREIGEDIATRLALYFTRQADRADKADKARARR